MAKLDWTKAKRLVPDPARVVEVSDSTRPPDVVVKKRKKKKFPPRPTKAERLQDERLISEVRHEALIRAKADEERFFANEQAKLKRRKTRGQLGQRLSDVKATLPRTL